MFRASSAHIQEDTVVYMHHMAMSLSTGVRGGLSVHSLSEFSLKHQQLRLDEVKTWHQLARSVENQHLQKPLSTNLLISWHV